MKKLIVFSLIAFCLGFSGVGSKAADVITEELEIEHVIDVDFNQPFEVEVTAFSDLNDLSFIEFTKSKLVNTMSKVTAEIALNEINDWLDYKKVNQKKRETYADNIDILVDAVMDGSLEKQEDHTLTQRLKFPIGNEEVIDELEYKPRLKMQTIHKHLQGVKPNDGDGRLCAYMAALTSQSKGIILGLDSEDYSIGQAIAIFFL